MDHVSMNDGLDGRETIAFGLVAGEIAVFVLALMTGYAVLRSGLPGAVAWSFAAVLVGGGAALAWLRVAGRPLLEWAVLLLRFVVRTRHAQVARLRRRLGTLWPRSARPLQAGAVVLPLALRRMGSEDAAVERKPPLTVVRHEPESAELGAAGVRRRSHVVAFFSLNGGTGRTALAVELAAILAVRGRAAAATRSPGRRAALLDLTERNPRVGLRLGIAPPVAASGSTRESAERLLTHQLGLLVWLPPAGDSDSEDPSPTLLIEAAEDGGAGIVVVDIDCDLGPRCVEVLRRCDQILITLTPTAGGLVDAYRSAAVLRRMGLRDLIGYVVNRWHPGIDIGETMADLRGTVAAEVPDDRSVVDAENSHRIAGLDGTGAVPAALTNLAEVIESAAGLQLSPVAARREVVEADRARSTAHQTGRG
jgi:hypothetical protein